MSQKSDNVKFGLRTYKPCVAVTSYVMQEVDDTAPMDHEEIAKPNPKAMPAVAAVYGTGSRSSPYSRLRPTPKAAAGPPNVVPPPPAAPAARFGVPAQPADPPTVAALCENFTIVAPDADIDPPLEPIALKVFTGDCPMSKAVEKYDAVITSCLDQVVRTVFYPVHHEGTFIRAFGNPIYKNSHGWYFFKSTQGWFLATELFDELASIEAKNKDCKLYVYDWP